MILLNPKDKKNLEEKLYCKPHCLPHKLPFTNPIERELSLSYVKIKYDSS